MDYTSLSPVVTLSLSSSQPRASIKDLKLAMRGVLGLALQPATGSRLVELRFSVGGPLPGTVWRILSTPFRLRYRTLSRIMEYFMAIRSTAQ